MSVIIGSYIVFCKAVSASAIFQISSHNISHAVNSTHIHIHQEDFDSFGINTESLGHKLCPYQIYAKPPP